MTQGSWPKALALGIVIASALWLAGIAIAAPVLQKGGAAQAPAAQDCGATATLLFSAASIALFIFSIIMTAASYLGWRSLRDGVRAEGEATRQKAQDLARDTERQATHRIDTLAATIEQRQAELEREMQNRLAATEKALRDRLANTERELQARSLTVQGYALGLLSTQVTQWEPTNKPQLREAVANCQRAFELVQDVDDKLRFLASNNLVYFATILNDGARANFLLAEARRLRQAGEVHNAHNLLMTFCRAVLQFSTDVEEITSARRIAAAVAENGESMEIRDEASFYRDRADKTLERATKGGEEKSSSSSNLDSTSKAAPGVLPASDGA